MSLKTDEPFALRVSGLQKSYPGVKALKDIDLTVRGGEVHGLVGENGAGKSTLMKMVAGAMRPDSGTVEVWGTGVAGDPRRAADAGVAMIYQELTIVPDMSAIGNVLLGRLPRRFGIIDRKRARGEFDEVAKSVGAHVSPSVRAGNLSIASQQLLEIMRALASDRRLVIMDEPTASLGPEDIKRLHLVIRGLRAKGNAVLYVSHDLDAVLEVCDTITVLREGSVVATQAVDSWTRGGLIRAMLGGVALDDAGSPATRTATGKSRLRIEGLRAPGVNLEKLDLRAGEIMGVAGLVGSGRTRLLRTIAGSDPVDSGAMWIDGRNSPWPRAPRTAAKLGIAFTPEDRKSQGLILSQASAWNVALGQFGAATRGHPVQTRYLSKWAIQPARRVGFAPTRLTDVAGTLSGGNQQKLVLARGISRPVSCLLLDEPTRGIDIAAKAQLFEVTRQMADEGCAILWSSSDLEELVRHSDRLLVLTGGRAVGELPGGSSVHDILSIAFNAEKWRNEREYTE